MNVLEMWCCLLFRSLPKPSLEEWLGSGLEEGITSLNLALPLDMGDERASKASAELLRDADDPLAKEYYKDTERGRLRPRPVLTSGSAPLPKIAYRTIKATEDRQPGVLTWVLSGTIGFCAGAVFVGAIVFARTRIRLSTPPSLG
jgi:hypothetical protein